MTALGKAVEECWEAIPQFYPQVQIIRKQVMPDHFHGILWVKDPLGCHLGQVVKGFKVGCNRAARRLCPGLLAEGAGLFAEGFQDSILFHEGQLEKMIAYIEANPLRLAVKRARPGLFTMVRGVQLSAIISPITEPAIISPITEPLDLFPSSSRPLATGRCWRGRSCRCSARGATSATSGSPSRAAG